MAVFQQNSLWNQCQARLGQCLDITGVPLTTTMDSTGFGNIGKKWEGMKRRLASVFCSHLQGHIILATSLHLRLSWHQASLSRHHSLSLDPSDNFLPHPFKPRVATKCSVLRVSPHPAHCSIIVPLLNCSNNPHQCAMVSSGTRLLHVDWSSSPMCPRLPSLSPLLAEQLQWSCQVRPYLPLSFNSRGCHTSESTPEALQWSAGSVETCPLLPILFPLTSFHPPLTLTSWTLQPINSLLLPQAL